MHIDKINSISNSQGVSNIASVSNSAKLNSIFLSSEERINLLFEPQELGVLSSFASVQDNVLIED